MTAMAAAWLAFELLRRALSGRCWLWLLPDLMPPLAHLAVPAALLVASPAVGPWCAALALAGLLAGLGDAGLNRRRARPAPPPAGAVRIVSWNTRYWHQGAGPKPFYAFLRGLRADVYALQEYIVGPHHVVGPVDDPERVRREFPGYHVVARGELVTISRFPVVAAPPVGLAREVHEHAGWRRVYDATKVLRTDLQVGAAVLSVYNVHIPAQYVPGDNPLARCFYGELSRRWRRRREQFAGLLADLEANRGPALVTGDFNSTGAMGEMRPLCRRLSSANRASRRRYLSSWPARGAALWQLDWTFTTGVDVHRYELADPGALSDHRVQALLVSVPHS
jgi:endonuclease/exonuclease/phosphatase (EEP) superfamily protein YafD